MLDKGLDYYKLRLIMSYNILTHVEIDAMFIVDLATKSGSLLLNCSER
jgi:hypothetical protein